MSNGIIKDSAIASAKDVLPLPGGPIKSNLLRGSIPVSYTHLVPKVNFTIDKAVLFQFPDEDLEVIRNDWKILIDKIKAGQAHLISEVDTMYLAACPKGRNS